MNQKIKYIISGFLIAVVMELTAIFTTFLLMTNDNEMIYHETELPNGKQIKITMCNLVWGIEHSERTESADCFEIEYIMSSPNQDDNQRDKEALEVFELIKPISEQWKIKKAALLAFPTLKRKGTYYVYSLDKDENGKWSSYKVNKANVHINDK